MLGLATSVPSREPVQAEVSLSRLASREHVILAKSWKLGGQIQPILLEIRAQLFWGKEVKEIKQTCLLQERKVQRTK